MLKLPRILNTMDRNICDMMLAQYHMQANL